MVTIYTISECPYCTELKDILTSNGIEYIDVNVELPENEATYNKIHDLTKSDQVPIIRVGNQLLVPNVSFNTIKDAGNIIKKLLG
jgi:glutaredoxin 3